MKRLVVGLLLALPLALACIGTGYTCDRGGVEVHVPVDVGKALAVLPEANVKPVGSFWGGGEENLHVLYSPIEPVLVYVWQHGFRVQIAVKRFEPGEREVCVLWKEPKDLNVKEVVGTVLDVLRSSGAVDVSDDVADKIVQLSGWGLAGNAWIDVKGDHVSVQAVRGCGGFPVTVWEGGEWPKIESSGGFPFATAVGAGVALIVLGVLLARLKP